MQEEQDWGSAISGFYFSVSGAALVTIVVAYIGWGRSGNRDCRASGGIYGILIAFGMLYGDRELFLFPIRLRSRPSIWLPS